MKVKSIELGRTFNLGNYESVKVGFVVDVTEDEKPFDTLLKLSSALDSCKQLHTCEYRRAQATIEDAENRSARRVEEAHALIAEIDQAVQSYLEEIFG